MIGVKGRAPRPKRGGARGSSGEVFVARTPPCNKDTVWDRVRFEKNARVWFSLRDALHTELPGGSPPIFKASRWQMRISALRNTGKGGGHPSGCPLFFLGRPRDHTPPTYREQGLPTFCKGYDTALGRGSLEQKVRHRLTVSHRIALLPFVDGVHQATHRQTSSIRSHSQRTCCTQGYAVHSKPLRIS